jgi:hypothetical protein
VHSQTCLVRACKSYSSGLQLCWLNFGRRDGTERVFGASRRTSKFVASRRKRLPDLVGSAAGDAGCQDQPGPSQLHQASGARGSAHGDTIEEALVKAMCNSAHDPGSPPPPAVLCESPPCSEKARAVDVDNASNRQGRAGQGRAGQGRAGQGRAGQGQGKGRCMKESPPRAPPTSGVVPRDFARGCSAPAQSESSSS